MKIVKQNSEFGLNIYFLDNDDYLAFTFGGNLDLYWSIHSKNSSNKHCFIITKENYGVYKLFEQLFNDIENINIFGKIDNLFYGKQEYEKSRYKLFNCSNYNELFDKENNTITWYSDETAHEVANVLKIKKEKDLFKIEFYIQPYVEGYDKDFYSLNYIPIRFRNSGSSYDPFNVVFMRMYNDMSKIDDINDYGHQIHIEEYLYSLNKVKKL